MKPIKVKLKLNEPEQKRLSFLRKFDGVSNGLKKCGPLELYNENDRIIWIDEKAKKYSKNTNFYALNYRDFSELNTILNRIYEREEKMKAEGYDLSGIKSFNRNVWLDFSKNSNAIEGIFDDFEFDLFDLRAKIRGKLNINPEVEALDLEDYYKELLHLYQKAKQDDDNFVITGKNNQHKLSIELVGQFLGLKYAYKVAKRQLKVRGGENSDENAKDDFCRLIFDVTSLLSGNMDVRFRTFPVYLQDGGAKWLPVNFNEISDKIDTLASWVTEGSLGKLHPIEKAAIFHAEYERIHPFADGNGRTGRILTNYILMENELPTISIGYQKREEYFAAIDKAIETHQIDDLVGLFYDSLLDTALKVDHCLDYIESKSKPTVKEDRTLN